MTEYCKSQKILRELKSLENGYQEFGTVAWIMQDKLEVVEWEGYYMPVILKHDSHKRGYSISIRLVKVICWCFALILLLGGIVSTYMLADMYEKTVIGYHNAKSHGGVIKGDGQYLKIGYVYYGNENIIVYIEEYPKESYFINENGAIES